MSAAEEAVIAAGDVVVRYGGPAAQTVAVVDVKATPKAVMASVMDLPARVRDIGSLSAVELYGKSGGQVSAKWMMSVAMVSVEFHIVYDCAMQRGWCVYTLDDSKSNDIESSNGSYQAYAHGDGTRLVYRTDAMAPGAPEWVRKRLVATSAQEMLGGMKARAEQ
jgi:carbon monoxide dehydrogenase subunit G